MKQELVLGSILSNDSSNWGAFVEQGTRETNESRKARPERSGDGEDDGAFQCGGRGEQGFGAG